MSDPVEPTTATDVIPEAPAAKRRSFFPGRLFGKDKEDPMPDPVEFAPPPVPVDEPTTPTPPAGSLTLTPVDEAPPAIAAPRITLPSTPSPSPARPMIPHDQQPQNPGHAVAQVTFSFGVTSFQLTPFFRLGSLELKALSEVVSLHLVAARSAEDPLAAGISFQIGHVELDGARLRSLVLRPLGDARPVAAPLSNLQVGGVAVMNTGDAPITVTAGGEGATAVQLVGTFAVAGIDFSPAFEVETLRLEPTTQTALLRVVPSSRPTALDLPPSFDFAEVRLGEGGRLDAVRLVPGATPAA